MSKQQPLWAALTLTIATTASCGTSVEHTPDGGGQGGAGASTSGAGGAGGACAAGETPCNGTCVNTAIDHANCGACGKACLMGQTCKLGICAGGCSPNLPACDDANPCSLDSCDPATLNCVFTPLMQGAPCNVNGGKVCDGNGACVACNAAADCPGITDDCQQPACINHTCGQVYAPANTPVSPALQIPGDCHVVVCDGAGSTKPVVDDTDIKSDGNPCTDDICKNGILSHPPLPPGTPCGIGNVCNGTGFCTDCISDAECTPPQTCGGCGMPGICCCKPKTCVEHFATCGIQPDNCGGMVQCNNNQQDGGETDVDCGGPSCSVKCPSGKKCMVNADCISNVCTGNPMICQ